MSEDVFLDLVQQYQALIYQHALYLLPQFRPNAQKSRELK